MATLLDVHRPTDVVTHVETRSHILAHTSMYSCRSTRVRRLPYRREIETRVPALYSSLRTPLYMDKKRLGRTSDAAPLAVISRIRGFARTDTVVYQAREICYVHTAEQTGSMPLPREMHVKKAMKWTLPQNRQETPEMSISAYLSLSLLVPLLFSH